MQKFRKYLAMALALGFFFVALSALINGQPKKRDREVYAQLKPFIPYKIEKCMSGLRIRNTKTGEKIEPSNSEIYHTLDKLESEWGKKHLRREGDRLIVLDDQNQTLKIIPLHNPSALNYVHNFFGL